MNETRFKENNPQQARVFRVPFCEQFKLLLARAIVFVKREPAVVKAKFG